LETIATTGGDIPLRIGRGAMHFALAIVQDDLETRRSHLQTHAVKIGRGVSWDGGGHSLYFHDPGGNLGELVSP